MNMTSVLHRSSGAHEQTSATDAPHATPTGDPRRRWPTGARALVGVLAIATAISTIAAVAGATDQGDDEQRALRERIAELTDERAAALDDVAALDTELDLLRQDLADAIVSGDELSDRVVDLQADIATVTAQRTAALEQVGELTATVEAQRLDLRDVRERLALAIQERDDLIDRFSFDFDVSLVGVDVAGKYRVQVTDVVGTTPKFTELTITRGSNGWLTVAAPGLAEGGFTMVDGVLQMVASSTTAAGSCDGVARAATVVMTIVPSGYEVADTGAQPTALDALITVVAPATGSCGATVAMSNASLTPIA